MQPLQKKIKQSLKTKRKIMQPLGTKNDSTSRDKKKSHNVSGQKNHTNTQDKKIIQIGLNSSNKIKYGLILSNMVQYAKKNTKIKFSPYQAHAKLKLFQTFFLHLS